MSVRPISIHLAGLLALPLLCLIDCGGSNGKASSPLLGPSFANDVYVAGFEGSAAKLWHVDFTVTPVAITPTVLPGGTTANALVEVGANVYAVGVNTVGANSTALYWQCNPATGTATATTLAVGGTATSAVASGSHVYFGGSTVSSAELWYLNTTTSAVSALALPICSSVSALAVSGSTLYATGAHNGLPMFWVVDISAGTPVVQSSTPCPGGHTFNAVAASGTKVYLNGYDAANNPAIWTVTNLTTTPTFNTPDEPFVSAAPDTVTAPYAWSSALAFSGSNLIVGGHVIGSPAAAATATLPAFPDLYAPQIGTADTSATAPLTFAITGYGPNGTYTNPLAPQLLQISNNSATMSSLAVSPTAIYAAGACNQLVVGYTGFGVATVWINQTGNANFATVLITDQTQNSGANGVIVH